MSLEHTTRAITENKYSMQLFADKESLKADIATMEKLKASNPSDERVSDYNISQKKYELSQIENRIKGKDYTSVKSQCEQYFADNSTLFDRNQIIAETRSMLNRGQTVNEWPHLAAVFLLDHASVTDKAKQDLAAVIPPKQDPAPPGSLSPGEHLVKPEKQSTKPAAAPSAKPQTVTPPTVQPKPENVPEILTVQQKIIFKDGAYYLTGPKGNTRRVEVSELLVNLNLPKNAPENLKKSVKMIEDFSLLLDAYIAANPKETTKHEAAVKQIQGLFAQEDIQMGKKVLDVTGITSGMFGNFWRTFSDTDLKKVNDAFRIQDEPARRLAIMNFIRDNLGQSDIVLGKIMENNPSYFAFPSDENILINGDLSAAGLSVAGRQSVEKAIRKAYLEAAGNWNKNYKEYIAQFKAQNPGAQVNEEEARKMNEKLTVLAVAKREIMYQKLYNQDLKSKPDLALAQDIMGAADFDMSDKSWDVSKEIGGMIAMEAIAIAAGVVTAGVATAAINTAMATRNIYRGTKVLEAYNIASKAKGALPTFVRILGSGAGFEAGAATTRSYIENGDFTSMHSLEGYTQSIAMMGVIGGIGKLITAGKFGKGIQFQEGAGFAKNTIPFVGQVAIEGTAIFGTSAAIGSVLFDRRDNWTLEQMAQAMLMAALFKGAGRLTASKNPKGEIEVKQTTTEKPATTTKKDVIPEGTFKSDSKVDLASFTTREITATDVRRAKVLINNGEYPQFIGKDGDIWSIRSVTGRSGKEVVEIGPLGKPSDWKISIDDFVEGVNANVRKFKPESIKPADSIADIARFTTREITATDVRRAKVLINNGEYPQFIAQDGTIWSIRSVTGRSGKEVVEIGPLGQPSLDRRATIQEFVEGVNANVRKFKVTPPKATETPTTTAPEVPVQKSSETPVEKAVEKPTQDTLGDTILEGKKLSSKNYNDFVDDIWKFNKETPDTRQLGDMVITYDKANKRITVTKGQEPTKIFQNKDEFKQYIASQDESMVATAMRNNRQAPKLESEWKVGTDKYLLTKDGKFYKNGTEMKLEDLSTLSGAETQKLFSVLYESNKGQIFADTVKSKFSSGAHGALDGAWYIASTPWKTNGFMSIPAYFTNLVRLPFINTRLVYETITTSGMANTQKFKDIVKTLVFSNKNGFDGFINGSITTLTTAAILYSQYMFVQEKQAKGELPQDMSWAGEAWAVTHRFLQANNIILPVDAWKEILSPRK